MDDDDAAAKVEAEEAVRTLLRFIGEDPSREGLIDTPRRFVEALAYCTSGYALDPRALAGEALFQENHSEIVVVKDIQVHSLCEHHLLPFFGVVHIGYIPKGKVVGLSKLARIARECFARRLQVQERLTTQIAEAIQQLVPSIAVGVIVECAHMCMEMRGVESVGSRTITTCMLGKFQSDEGLRRHFESLVWYNKKYSRPSEIPTPNGLGNSNTFDAPTTDSTAPVAANKLPADHASDFLLFTKIADDEYKTMADLFSDSITGMKGPLSLMDIGAGNGTFLRHLCSRGLQFDSYTAFEPNPELASQLERFLASKAFEPATKSTVVQKEFSSAISSTEHPVADIVLISHSLYGIENKDVFLEKAMEFDAKGGVLIVFHRNTQTVLKLSESLGREGILSFVTSRNFFLNVEGLNKDELIRMSRYTLQDLSKSSMSLVDRTVGMLAIEPHSCNLETDVEVADRVAMARSRVSFGARSGKPKAVVQPQTGTLSCKMTVLLEICYILMSHSPLCLSSCWHSSMCSSCSAKLPRSYQANVDWGWAQP
jgi:GTP cyclohydrolase IA